jgi:hypothetical protein
MEMTPKDAFDRSVLVYPKGEKMCDIKPYHGCYDVLAYPLLKPKGETEWNMFMSYNDSPKESTSPNDCEDSVQQPLGMATIHIQTCFIYPTNIVYVYIKFPYAYR